MTVDDTAERQEKVDALAREVLRYARDTLQVNMRYMQVALGQLQPEPIYITKNGYGDLVIMSIETFEKKICWMQTKPTQPLSRRRENIKIREL